jgi:hypothetical protein
MMEQMIGVNLRKDAVEMDLVFVHIFHADILAAPS